MPCKNGIFENALSINSANWWMQIQFDKTNWWMPNGWSCVCCFLDIFMYKTEEDVVLPAKPIFDKSFVDDTYIRRKKNDNDELFQKINSYHLSIKLTLEENPRKFLDTKIIRDNNIFDWGIYKVNKVSCSLEFQYPN